MPIQEQIIFDARFDEANKSLKDFSSNAGKAFAGLGASLKTLGPLAAAFVAALSVREIIQGLGAAVAAATESEEALNQLNTAMALAGDYSKDASSQFQAFASQLQATTKFEDDAVIKQLAMAKSFGVSNEEAKKLVKTAADLASATGVSLDAAVDQLGKTLTGTTGTLGKTIPGLKDLSEAALKSGAAIEIIAKRFGGASEAAVQTFGGSVTQLKNVFGGLQEEIGNVIVQNPVVLAGIQGVSKIFGKLTEIVMANQDTLKGFVSTVTTLAFNALPYVVDAFEILGKVFLAIREVVLNVVLAWASLLSAFYDLKAVQIVFKTVFTVLQTYLATTIEGIAGFLGLLGKLPGAGKYLDPIVSGLDGMVDKINSVTGDDALGAMQGGIEYVGTAAAESLEKSDALFASFTEGAKSARTFTEGLATSVETAGQKASQAVSIFDKLNASGGAVEIDSEDKKKPKEKKSKKEKEEGSVIGSIASGIATGADIAAKTFNGGFVNQFASFIQGIGQAPQAFLDAFKNLDGIIQGLLDSLPAIIDSLLEQAPVIIKRIIDAIPELVQMIIKGLSAIADVISDSAPALFNAILDGVTALVDAIPAIVDKTVQALPKVFKAILQKLPALITAILKAIPQIVRSIVSVLPELIAVLAENIGPIVLALVQGILEAIPEIILVLVDEFIVKGGLFKIIASIIQAIPQIVIALVQGIIRAAYNSTGALIQFLGGSLGKMFSSSIKLPKFDLGQAKDFLTGKLFADKVKQNFALIKDFLNGKLFATKVKSLFDKFIEQIKQALSGGLAGGKKGGAANVLSKAGIKFAEGGQAFRVPGGFPNDTFPARLTSGELVVDRSTAAKLREFLDGDRPVDAPAGGGMDMSAMIATLNRATEKNVTVNLTVGEKELASVLLNLNRQGFRTA